MHYIADVKTEDPVVLPVSFNAEGGARSYFEPLLALQIVDLLESLK